LPDYPWYDVVPPQSDLEQGDFIARCPVVIPPSQYAEGETVGAEVREYNVIVVSQSCDLVTARPKIRNVLVCPYAELTEATGQHPLASTSQRETARRGNLPGFHIIEQCGIAGEEFGVSFVALKEVYAVSFQFLRERADTTGDRLRLLPPYREHLSQAFARFFMRVGLPIDIPPFQ